MRKFSLKCSKFYFAQLDRAIKLLSLTFMDGVVCEGLQHGTMQRLVSCQDYTTTTTQRISKLPQTDAANNPNTPYLVLVTLLLASLLSLAI